MGRLSVLVGKHHIAGQRSPEAGRLVHIVPHPGHAKVYQIFLLFLPPPAHFRIAEIREYRVSRPHHVDVDFSLRRGGKIAVLYTLLVDIIILFHLYPRVNDGNSFDSHFLQIGNHLPLVPVGFLIPCKNLIVIHVVNVKMNAVAGNFIFLKLCGNIPDFILGLVAPAGLMVAQRPHLLHGSSPRQPCIIRNDVLKAFPGHEIIIQISLIRADYVITAVFLPQIEISFPVIVKENAVSPLLLQHHHKGNALVKRLEIILLRVGKVGVPHFILVFPFV